MPRSPTEWCKNLTEFFGTQIYVTAFSEKSVRSPVRIRKKKKIEKKLGRLSYDRCGTFQFFWTSEIFEKKFPKSTERTLLLRVFVTIIKKFFQKNY